MKGYCIRNTIGLAVGLWLAAGQGVAGAQTAADKATPAANPAPSTSPVNQAALASPNDPQITASFLVGTSIPINGLNYNAGIGIRAGATFGHFYVGSMLAVHQGDSKSIVWPAVPELGLNAGVQQYNSLPIFGVADGGYELTIRLGPIVTVLTPYVSAGLLVTTMTTSGVYGNSTIDNTYFVLGGGFSYSLRVGPRWSIGLHYRVYDTGDTTFSFGDLSKNTIQHGFSTSIFYAAFYSELSYHF